MLNMETMRKRRRRMLRIWGRPIQRVASIVLRLLDFLRSRATRSSRRHRATSDSPENVASTRAINLPAAHPKVSTAHRICLVLFCGGVVEGKAPASDDQEV